jgi:hypothetical protein
MPFSIDHFCLGSKGFSGFQEACTQLGCGGLQFSFLCFARQQAFPNSDLPTCEKRLGFLEGFRAGRIKIAFASSSIILACAPEFPEMIGSASYEGRVLESEDHIPSPAISCSHHGANAS